MKEFIPAFRFLAIFLGLYLGFNIIYGLWISSFGMQADSATMLITQQTSQILNLVGEGTHTQPKPNTPTVAIFKDNRIALSVFEGCNSINVMIVFISFLFAFKGSWKKLAWFLPLGLVIIYVANLVRITALYYVAEYWRQYFYYIHKYMFTAVIYLIVFILWWWWIEKISGVSVKEIIKSRQS
ncbi:MAG TPA: exosortase family protein XrtF [Cytophagales bacterium]|nr:exosortase family protein XrtF [Cytophagales bacterium]HRG10551.1 exosortase family protein XrtF [Cyclobacteriaceae bacterium]